MAEAVLCDLDGTLIDSEVLHHRAWFDTLAENGLSPRHDWPAESVAIPDAAVAEHLLAAHPQLAGKDILGEKQRRYQEMVRALGPNLAFPGVKTELTALRAAGVPLAVATNSLLRYALFSLETAGLRDCFDVVVALDMVQRPKPHPDLYLEAARRLHTPPAQCAVLEDSLTGLEAGRAAGCLVLGIASSLPPDRMDAAQRVFKTTAAALAWLGSV